MESPSQLPRLFYHADDEQVILMLFAFEDIQDVMKTFQCWFPCKHF
jgi:hypothetical protein